MGSIKFDHSDFPLVRVTFVGDATNEEFAAYLAEMGQLFLRRKPNATVLDAREAGMTPATQRRMQAEWIREHEDDLRRFSRGTAFVISSPVIRGALTAILWLQPMPQPHVVVATVAEAEAWAKARLDAPSASRG